MNRGAEKATGNPLEGGKKREDAGEPAFYGAPRTAIMHLCCIGVCRDQSVSRCMLAPRRVFPGPSGKNSNIVGGGPQNIASAVT
jgi:hypothetical protein